MWNICNWKYIYAIITGSRNKFYCLPLECFDKMCIKSMICSLPHTCCLQNWFQNFCCIFYALLLCSRCNINLSPPIKANTAKISTQEFLTNRLRKNMKLLILLYITAYYSNILFLWVLTNDIRILLLLLSLKVFSAA